MKMANIPTLILAAAQAAHKSYPVVPTSVCLAQFGLESAWGTKVTGKNNFFGEKASPGDSYTACHTHEVIHGCVVAIIANFKNYTSPADAFMEHSRHLATSPYYVKAQAAKTAEDFAHALTGVYATDPEYGNKIVEIMRQSSLEKYDS